jgi:hypothetical protein
MHKIKVRPIACTFHQRRHAAHAMLYTEPCRSGTKIEHIVPICGLCLASQAANPPHFELRIRTIVKRWAIQRQAYQRYNHN